MSNTELTPGEIDALLARVLLVFAERGLAIREAREKAEAVPGIEPDSEQNSTQTETPKEDRGKQI